MKNICKKCNKEFLSLYDGICHQCWSQIKSSDNLENNALRIYRCPACDRQLFKGNVARLAMACPRCNHFVKIPAGDA